MGMMGMRLMSRKGKPTEPPCKTKPSGKVWRQLKKSSHSSAAAAAAAAGCLWLLGVCVCCCWLAIILNKK